MNSSIVLILIAFGLIVTGFVFYEKSKYSVREIPLFVILIGISALSRVPFCVVPGLQPSSFIVIISGYVFGPLAGFIIGSSQALIANIVLGQGPWTVWQMFGWGLGGLIGGIIGKLKNRAGFPMLVFFSFLFGFIFGAIMNIWHWVTFVFPHTLKTFLAVSALSLWFDLIHGVGNAIFVIFIGKFFINTLGSYKKKLELLTVEK